MVTVAMGAQVCARGVETHSLLEGWKMDPGGLWGGWTALMCYARKEREIEWRMTRGGRS